jgi:hypothetical protein
VPQPEAPTARPKEERRWPGLRTGLLLVGGAFAIVTLLPAAKPRLRQQEQELKSNTELTRQIHVLTTEIYNRVLPVTPDR